MTVGRIFSNAIVVSLQLSAPIHYDPGCKLYDRRAKARIGTFLTVGPRLRHRPKDADWTKVQPTVVRILVACALPFAAGSYAGIRPLVDLGAWSLYPDGGMILCAAVLMLLNFGDGIRRLSRLPHPRAFIVPVTVPYVIVSVRMVEIMAAFRSRR